MGFPLSHWPFVHGRQKSFDGAAQVQAAQVVVDTAVAERDAAQAASDEAAARLGEAMGAFGAATTIADQNAVVEGVSDVTYDGKAQAQPNARLLIVMRGPDGREEAYELGRGTDYDVTFSGNKNAGTATMAFSATGLYAGGTSVTFQIAPATVSSVEVSGAYTYAGSPIQPKLTVRAGGLTLGTGDFTAACTNNTNAGTAHVKVTGKGNFKGSKEAGFQIAQASLANAKVTAADQTFSGSELRPVPTVTLGNKAIPADEYAASYKESSRQAPLRPRARRAPLRFRARRAPLHSRRPRAQPPHSSPPSPLLARLRARASPRAYWTKESAPRTAVFYLQPSSAPRIFFLSLFEVVTNHHFERCGRVSSPVYFGLGIWDKGTRSGRRA